METIQIWNRCNNRCVMCTNPLWFSREAPSAYSFAEIDSRIRRVPDAACADGLQISGGEPTIHPRFFDILRSLRERVPRRKIYVLTNGRMFAYDDFAREALAFDGLVFEIPLLGHTARLHDRVTGARGSFAQTVAGVRNILKRKKKSQELEIRVVLVRQNYKAADKIAEFAHRSFTGIDTFVVLFPEPEGRCAVDFKKVGLVYSQAGETVSGLAMKWKDKFADMRFYHFPLCTVGPAVWPLARITQYPGETAFISRCRKCGVKKRCPGIHKNYLKLVGDGEFRAPRGGA